MDRNRDGGSDLTVRNLHEADVLLSGNSARASRASGYSNINGEVHVDVGCARNEIAGAETKVRESTRDVAVGLDVALVTWDIYPLLAPACI